ncbi:diguanylate cyclase [Waterburya agarophytonicola K14]|uniref:Diguanylate cyclase n=1 Tax=Waterburya agarophytonicola KI4 TaxID=2874699 RepID=A0A964FHT7_9CYAN|nr:diguanylate cyclase [Waterburya agarophytonicola KI4]
MLFLTFGISGLAIALNYLKIFQSLEWSAYDTWFRLRSTEAKEKRIVVVTINESDIGKLGQWPMSDIALSQLIDKIHQQQPRAIGLDIYRDLPVAPGTKELETVLRSTPNLVGVEKIIGEKIQPSPILQEKNQTALSDLVRDGDGTIRRGLLSVELDSGQIKLGLGTRLALMYLAPAGIAPEPIGETGTLALGKGRIIPFNSNDGGYVRADAGGFQILINYRGTETSFDRICINDVLNDRIPDNLFSDRLVLIGSIAPSLNDFFPTPYSDSRESLVKDLPGVLIHANIASQIISSALDGRNSIKTVNEPLEWIWIFAWTYSVSMLNIVLLDRQSDGQKNIFTSAPFATFMTCFAIVGSGYLLFLGGLWLPIITPVFSVAVSGILISWYCKTNQEEQQKKLAFTDGLTEIPNRRFFDEFLKEQWQKNRQKERSLSIILCDVDFFKKYNDTYGHQAGDLCLKEVAKVLAQSVRDSDLAARYGGEEFVAVLPDTPPDAAIAIAQRICDRLKSLQMPHVSSQASEYVSISCGVTCTTVSVVHSPEELIECADRALYQAKEQGRDRAVLWQEQ